MRIIVGITGATGVIYGVRLIEKLKSFEENIEVHLIVSKWAEETLKIETEYTIDYLKELADFTYSNDNLAASVSSGSFITDGMVILPCSMKTLSAISISYNDTLITRVADVMLKERRNLVICPRETPLNSNHLENMLKVSKLGATIVPPMPAFYNKPQNIDDIINHTVMKVLDQLRLHCDNERRWK